MYVQNPKPEMAWYIRNPTRVKTATEVATTRVGLYAERRIG